MPTKGSGARGGVKKRDIATALVDGVFPQLAAENPDERVRIIDLQCGEVKETIPTMPEDTPESMLKLLGALDPQEQEAFKPLIQEALKKLDSDEKKRENKIRLQAKLEASGAQKSMEPVELGAARERASGSGAARASSVRQRAPEEFTRFLPDVPSLYIHWEPRSNRVYAEFKKLENHQRTKSKAFDQNHTLRSKVNALVIIFEYIHQAYHCKFSHLSNYNADWKPVLETNLINFCFILFENGLGRYISYTSCLL